LISNNENSRQSISTTSIASPSLRSDTKLIDIPEPTDGEIIRWVEKFINQTVANTRSATIIDWNHYASEHPAHEASIRELQAKLEGVDDSTHRAIADARLTMYAQIRKARSQEEAAAKQATKKPFKEFFYNKQKLKDARHLQRRQIIQNRVNPFVEDAANAFMQRVKYDKQRDRKPVKVETGDFVKGRLRGIRDECLTFLAKHAPSGKRGEPLYDLVEKISPQAIEKFEANADVVEKISPQAIEKFEANADVVKALLSVRAPDGKPLSSDIVKFLQGATVSEILASKEDKK
jgi:hypothetical protein